MIFKTFDGEIGKVTTRIGILGKSFADIGNAINEYATDWETDDSFWDKLFPSQEKIQEKLIDVNKLFPKLDASSASEYLNVIKSIDNGTNKSYQNFQDYYDELNEGKQWIAGYAQSTKGQIRTTEDLIKANEASRASTILHNNAIKSQTLSAKAGSVALKGLAIAGNMLAMFAVVKGIELAVKAFDDWNRKVEIAAENAQKSAEAVKSLEGEITSLNEQIKTSNDRVEELAALPNLTFVEQEELERLKETTKELETQLRIKRGLKDVAIKTSRNDSLKYLNTTSDYQKYEGMNPDGAGAKYADQIFVGSQIELASKKLADYNVLLKEKENLSKKISEVQMANSDYENDDSYLAMSNNLYYVDAELGTLSSDLNDFYANASKFDDYLNPSIDKSVIDTLHQIYDTFDETFNTGKSNTDKFNELWDSDKFKPYKKELEELSISGKLSPEVLESNKEYQKLLEATGLTAEQVAEHINSISKEAEGAARSSYKLGESVTAWKAALDSDNQGKVYEELTKGLEEAKKLYDEGLVGTDDFKSYAKMLSPTGADDAENFAENYKKAMRYLENADASGVQNFLVDLSKKTNDAGEAFVTFDEKTKQWNINIRDTEEAAKALGTGTEVVEASMKRLSDYGFDVNWIDSLDMGAEKIAEYYAEIAELEADDTIEPKVKSEQIDILNDKINTTLSLMDELSQKDAFDFSADIDNAKANIQSYYDQIQKIMDGGVDLGGNEAKVVSKMYSKIQELAGESGINLKADLEIDATQVNEYLAKAGEETIINVDGEETTTVLEKINGLIDNVVTGVVDLGTKAIGDLGAETTKTKLQGVIDKLDAIRVKAETPITQKVNVTRTESGTAQLSGTVPQLSARALALGSLSASGIHGTAYASGTGRTTKDERALTGELGQELVVNYLPPYIVICNKKFYLTAGTP